MCLEWVRLAGLAPKFSWLPYPSAAAQENPTAVDQGTCQPAGPSRGPCQSRSASLHFPFPFNWTQNKGAIWSFWVIRHWFFGLVPFLRHTFNIYNEPEDVSVSTELNRINHLWCFWGFLFQNAADSSMCGSPETPESLNPTHATCGTIMILSPLAFVFSPKEHTYYILPAAAVFAPAFTPSDHLPSFVCLCIFLTVPHQRGACVCKCLT